MAQGTADEADRESGDIESVDDEIEPQTVVAFGGNYTVASFKRGDGLLDAKGGGTTAGTAVQIYHSNGTDAQVWTFVQVGSYYKIVNAKSGLVLDVAGGSAKNGAKVQLYGSNDTMAQRWVLLDSGKGDGSVVVCSALDQKLALDLPGGSTSDKTLLQLYSRNQSDAQVFRLTAAQTKQEKADALAAEHAGDLADATYLVSPSKNSGTALSVNGSSAKLVANEGKASIAFTVTHDANGYVTFTTSDGKVLDISGGSTANGATLQRYKGNGSRAQKWVAVKTDDRYKLVSALDTGLVVDCASGSTAEGTKVQMWTSNDSSAQRWTFTNLSEIRSNLDQIALANKNTIADGTYAIAGGDGSSRLVLDVASGSTDSGANVRLWNSNGTIAQRWTIKNDQQTGYVTITNAKSGKVLDVSGGSACVGANVQQYSSNNSYAQKWIIAKSGDGYIVYSALYADRVLDIASGSFNKGANIQTYSSNGSKAQQFKFYSNNISVSACEDILPSDGWYSISSPAVSGKVLDVESGSNSNGANVRMYGANQSFAQLYRFTYVNGYYAIEIGNSGKYVNVADGDIVPGANVQQWGTAKTDTTSLFSATDNGDGTYSFVNVASGLTLAVSGDNLVAAEATGSTSQKFKIAKQSNLISQGVYTIAVASSSSMVLDVASGSTSDGANIQAYSSNGTFAQKWYIAPVSGKENTYIIECVASGKRAAALSNNDVRQKNPSDDLSQQWIASLSGGKVTFISAANSSKVLCISGTNACVAAPSAGNSDFKISSTSASISNGTYFIRMALDTGKVVDVAAGSYAKGANVQICANNNSGAQKWKITSNGDGTVTITNAASELALDVSNSSATNGANVQQWTPNGSSAQKWRIVYAGGGYKIVSALNGNIVLDVAGGSTASGTNVDVYTSNDSSAQRFSFVKTTYSAVYHGFQNPSQYYQVSNITVKVKNNMYVTPSRLSLTATKQDCINTMIQRAREYIGTTYKWDHTGAPGTGIDCAGLVMQCLYACGMDFGTKYNPYDHLYTAGHDHYANDMWNDGKFYHVSYAQRQVGDLVCYSGHIGIYIGNDQIIDAYPGHGINGVAIRSATHCSGMKGCLRPFV